MLKTLVCNIINYLCMYAFLYLLKTLLLDLNIDIEFLINDTSVVSFINYIMIDLQYKPNIKIVK